MWFPLPVAPTTVEADGKAASLNEISSPTRILNGGEFPHEAGSLKGAPSLKEISSLNEAESLNGTGSLNEPHL